MASIGPITTATLKEYGLTPQIEPADVRLDVDVLKHQVLDRGFVVPAQLTHEAAATTGAKPLAKPGAKKKRLKKD